MGAKTFAQIIGKKAAAGRFAVIKSDDDKKQVFGWGSVAASVGGEPVVDGQDDIIDIEELESAAYEFVLKYREAGENHENPGVGQLIESVVFTKAKMDAMGIPEGTVPYGLWLGFQITDDGVWAKIKSGEYASFSIEGEAVRVPV